MFTKANAEAYFNAEKSESLLFVIIGILAILLALGLFFFQRSPFCKGFAIPLALIGIIQLVAGATVYNRSDKQRVDIVYKMDIDPAALQTAEIPRMEKVMRSFELYRNTEIALLVIAIALFLYTRNKAPLQFWTGIAVALAIQASIMLIADGFAESRGRIYLAELKAHIAPKPASFNCCS